MLTFNIVLGYQGLLFRDFFWFFFRCFCFSIQLTDPYQETHSTVNKEKKGDGLRYIFFSLLASFPFFLLLALSLCFTRLCGSHISSNKWLNWFTSHQLHYYIACIIGVLWANRGKCSILCKAQNERKVQDEEKIVVPVISPLFWLFHPPMPTNIDWRWWCQKDQWKHIPLLQNCYHSGYQKHWQQHKPLEITTARACMNHQ